MCGITGILDFKGQAPTEHAVIRRMLGVLHHRGPDECGYYRDLHACIGNVRLSIVDLAGGCQPIHNEDQRYWIVFNGEIYNHIELRRDLEARGHRFYTCTDTEVIVHLYETYGAGYLSKMNGQFALAIWDRQEKRLLLARDRVGIRPLYYAWSDGALIFGSEVKSLIASNRVEPRIDPEAIDQIFTFWTTLPGASIFEGVRLLPPGSFLMVDERGSRMQSYWQMEFPEAGQEDGTADPREKAQELRPLLEDATRLRLRADVTVGAYLSGGIDSSTITALTHRSGNDMRTFSIAFSDANYDERRYQDEMVEFLGTHHSRVECDARDIGRVFPEVIRHAEMPVLRTSPAPMYLLSDLVRREGVKVVLTGEGADEILCGYNLFREAKVRRFWARDPSSKMRPKLLSGLYGYIAGLQGSSAYMENFFRQGLENTDLPWYSHSIRWGNTARLKRLFSQDLKDRLIGYDPLERLAGHLPAAFNVWSHTAQAQYLEVVLFMSGYLLSAQGDRVMAGNSIEGRFPFLDHRVIEFCNTLPPRLKLCGLDEKHLLKKAVAEDLPLTQRERPKQPYRAPIFDCFLGEDAPDYVRERLAPQAVEAAGHFNPRAVAGLLKKGEARKALSETEEMALVGILSTQLIHHQFVERFSEQPIMDFKPAAVFDFVPASQPSQS
ncbi:MAG: asparagine synthase (glutamine-hydrolyzing) [Planctomycetes bacterium]|nr:asparagine synthase (glutamine-hydrolyzing) [Planctomycetota bacterium]